MLRHTLYAFLLILVPALAAAEGLMDRFKERAAETYQRGSDLVKDGAVRGKELTEQGVDKGAELTEKGVEYGKQFADDTSQHFNRQGTPAEIRAAVDQMAIDTLDRLFENDPEAHVLFDRSSGYAVFDVRQVSVGVAAGYGYGVAVDNDGDQRIYMKMATGGVGVSYGFGGFASELVVLFEDAEAFRRFVDVGFSAGAEASGMAGEERTELSARFRDGLAFYRVTKKGLNVAAALTGTRFWPDEALN